MAAPGALPEAISRSIATIRRFSPARERPISSGREAGRPARAGGRVSSKESSVYAAKIGENRARRKGEPNGGAGNWTARGGRDRVAP